MTVSPDAKVDQPRSWFNRPVEDVVTEFATNADTGLSAAEARSRLASHGPLTTSLTGGQWVACIALALVVPITIGLSKIPRRRHLPAPAPIDAAHAVSPARALAS